MKISVANFEFFLFFRGRITLGDSIGFLILYVIYITVVIVGRIVNQMLRKRRQDQQELIDNNVSGL